MVAPLFIVAIIGTPLVVISFIFFQLKITRDNWLEGQGLPQKIIRWLSFWRRGKLRLPDPERARTIDHTERHQRQGIEMEGFQPSGEASGTNSPRRFANVVPSNVAPIAKSLQTSVEEIKGVGGGFVSYYTSSGKSGKRGKERDDRFEDQDLYSDRPPVPTKDTPEQTVAPKTEPKVEIAAPEPIHKAATYVRWFSTQNVETAVYGGNEVKPEATWTSIAKREPLVQQRSSKQSLSSATGSPRAPPARLFENVDLNNEKEVGPIAKHLDRTGSAGSSHTAEPDFRSNDQAKEHWKTRTPVPTPLATKRSENRVDDRWKDFEERKRKLEQETRPKAEYERQEVFEEEKQREGGMKKLAGGEQQRMNDVHVSNEELHGHDPDNRSQTSSAKKRKSDDSAITYTSTVSNTSSIQQTPSIKHANTHKEIVDQERTLDISNSDGLDDIIQRSRRTSTFASNISRRPSIDDPHPPFVSKTYGSKTNSTRNPSFDSEQSRPNFNPAPNFPTLAMRLSLADSGLTSFGSNDTSYQPSYRDSYASGASDEINVPEPSTTPRGSDRTSLASQYPRDTARDPYGGLTFDEENFHHDSSRDSYNSNNSIGAGEAGLGRGSLGFNEGEDNAVSTRSNDQIPTRNSSTASNRSAASRRSMSSTRSITNPTGQILPRSDSLHRASIENTRQAREQQSRGSLKPVEEVQSPEHSPRSSMEVEEAGPRRPSAGSARSLKKAKSGGGERNSGVSSLIWYESSDSD
jgi:hypothetical protein